MKAPLSPSYTHLRRRHIHKVRLHARRVDETAGLAAIALYRARCRLIEVHEEGRGMFIGEAAGLIAVVARIPDGSGDHRLVLSSRQLPETTPLPLHWRQLALEAALVLGDGHKWRPRGRRCRAGRGRERLSQVGTRPDSNLPARLIRPGRCRSARHIARVRGLVHEAAEGQIRIRELGAGGQSSLDADHDRSHGEGFEKPEHVGGLVRGGYLGVLLLGSCGNEMVHGRRPKGIRQCESDTHILPRGGAARIAHLGLYVHDAAELGHLGGPHLHRQAGTSGLCMGHGHEEAQQAQGEERKMRERCHAEAVVEMMEDLSGGWVSRMGGGYLGETLLRMGGSCLSGSNKIAQGWLAVCSYEDTSSVRVRSVRRGIILDQALPGPPVGARQSQIYTGGMYLVLIQTTHWSIQTRGWVVPKCGGIMLPHPPSHRSQSRQTTPIFLKSKQQPAAAAAITNAKGCCTT